MKPAKSDADESAKLSLFVKRYLGTDDCEDAWNRADFKRMKGYSLKGTFVHART